MQCARKDCPYSAERPPGPGWITITIQLEGWTRPVVKECCSVVCARATVNTILGEVQEVLRKGAPCPKSS